MVEGGVRVAFQRNNPNISQKGAVGTDIVMLLLHKRYIILKKIHRYHLRNYYFNILKESA